MRWSVPGQEAGQGLCNSRSGYTPSPQPFLSHWRGGGGGERAFDSSPKTALGLQELKGSLQGGEGCSLQEWRGRGAQKLLGHQTALAKLFDELSANEFETDNEVPFRDTWAEKK